MCDGNKSYAVVFTYSWDNDAAVYLFDTENEAADFLYGAYEAEFRNDMECGFGSDGFLDESRGYARIVKPSVHSAFENEVTEFHLARVYE